MSGRIIIRFRIISPIFQKVGKVRKKSHIIFLGIIFYRSQNLFCGFELDTGHTKV